MILNELFCTNCVEVYTPNVYNILFDSFIKSPNIMIKAMAFKFLSHLECNWNEFASDPLKQCLPKRMTLKIYNRLKIMFDKLYFLEKRSENDHFSPLLNALSEFLSRINWIEIIDDDLKKEDDDDDDDEDDEEEEKERFKSLTGYRDYIKFENYNRDKYNIVYMDGNREWNTYKLNHGISSGIGYWTFQINSSQRPTMICVGIITSKFDCNKKCIGSTNNSIGLLGDGSLWRFGQMISSQFTSKQFEAGTKIGILLDMNRRELTFTINGNNAVTSILHDNKHIFSENMLDLKYIQRVILPPSSIIIFPQTTPTLSVGTASSSSSSSNDKSSKPSLSINQWGGPPPSSSSNDISSISQRITNENLKSGIIIDINESNIWYPAVSLYSKKDAIHLIKEQCWFDIGNINKFSILPQPIPKCNKYINIIKTIICINQNEFDLIAKMQNDIINDINLWLLLWIRNKNRFLRFGSFGYDVIIKSENFIKYKVEVGDVVTFSSKICRIMGEYRNRIILNQSNSNSNSMYFVDWRYFEKIKINNSGKFKKKYCDELKKEYLYFEETAEDIENGIFEATLSSLSIDDLIDINREINNLSLSINKTPFDLTINDFLKHNMAKNNIICGFALIRYINKYIHLLFPLFNPSSYLFSYFNNLLSSIQDIIFSHVRMSLILHLFTDNVDHNNSSRIKSIQLNNWIGISSSNMASTKPISSITMNNNNNNNNNLLLTKPSYINNVNSHYDKYIDTNLHFLEFIDKQREISIFGQLSSKINQMGMGHGIENIFRCLIPDRHGQLRIFIPSFNLESCQDEGGQYRQLFNIIINELFGGKCSNYYKFLNHPIASQLKLRLFSKIKNNKDCNHYIPRYYGFGIDSFHLHFELEILKLFETFGRIIGLSVRSLLNINIPFPDWFWDLLWKPNKKRILWDTNFNQLIEKMKLWILNSSDLTENNQFNQIEEISQLSPNEIYKIISSSLTLFGRGKKQIFHCRRLKKSLKFQKNKHIHSQIKQISTEWINIAIYTKFHQFDQYISAIRKGLFFILPKQIEYLFLNGKEFKLLINGGLLSSFSIQQQLASPLSEKYVISKISIENKIVLLLESRAIYCEPLNRNSKHIDMFWKVLFSFNKYQLFKFIKFISGNNIWPLYITSHSNPSQMITNIYSNYIEIANKKKLPITQINLSSDILYDIEYINYLIKSYHLYGSIMHNQLNNDNNNNNNYFISSSEMNHLWIIDECYITFCNQTSLMKSSPNSYLPEVHTCTVSIRLPSYSSEKHLKIKLLKAMDFCNTFDSFTNKGNNDFPISKIIQKRSQKFKSNITKTLQKLFK